MPEADYYGGGETATEPKPATSQAPMEDESKEQEQVQTAIVPVSIFPGGPPKPGDDCMFTVVRVHGDEVELEYKNEETEEPTENDSEMGETGGQPAPQMSSMSEY